MILNILTTATPRPELQVETLLPWLRALHESRIFDRINWFVNLDKPSIFTAKQFLIGKKFIHERFRYLHIHYTENLVNPTFAKSSRTLYENCKKNINKAEDNYFFWLEDDWVMDREKSIDAIKNYLLSGKDILLFNGEYKISGNPNIVRQKFFDGVHDVVVRENIDPEMAMMKAKYEIYPEIVKTILDPRDPLHEELCYIPSVCLCTDIGRTWRNLRNVHKTSKLKVDQDTWRKINK